MRTLTTIALATAMLFTVATANAATTHKRRHHRKPAAQGEKSAKAPKSDTKAAAPATK